VRIVVVLKYSGAPYPSGVEQMTVTIDQHESVAVRVREFNGRWIASADTPSGPSLGLARDRLAAIYMALDPYQPRIDRALDELVLVASEACTP
jgi:hypothetical protein